MRRAGGAAAGVLPILIAVLLLSTGCGQPVERGGASDPGQVDAVETPQLGACRSLRPADVAEATNATKAVACSESHTAQTYAVGSLPADLADAGYDSTEVGGFAYDTCATKLRAFLGADESLALRTVLQWAWFRPSEKAWAQGARWYRCDVVGGSEQSAELSRLPETAEGLLLGRPDDAWLVCVNGASVSGGTKVPCSQPHDWRAATTIKLGEPEDSYPGDRLAEVTTRDYCSDSIGAWLNYPVDFDYGYTWFHRAEWKAGNRRSVCWAKTSD